MIMQHALLNPIVYVPTFFAINGCLTGQSPIEIEKKMGAEYHDTLLHLWGFWVPTTALVFRFVAERHQAVLMAAVSLVWNTMLSLLANSGGERANRRQGPKTKASRPKD